MQAMKQRSLGACPWRSSSTRSSPYQIPHYSQILSPYCQRPCRCPSHQHSTSSLCRVPQKTQRVRPPLEPRLLQWMPTCPWWPQGLQPYLLMHCNTVVHSAVGSIFLFELSTLLQAFEHQFNSKSDSDSKKSPKKAKSPQKRKAAAAATNTPQSAYYSIRGILDENET